MSPIDGAKCVAEYIENYYAGEPAIIKNSYGLGESYYFGGAFTEGAVEVFLKKLSVINPYGGVIDIPEKCELAVREKDNKKYLFVLNYDNKTQTVYLKESVRELVLGEAVIGDQLLKPYEVKVYTLM